MVEQSSLALSFEGIDPPLLDPTLSDHFNNLYSAQARNGACQSVSLNKLYLQSLSLEELQLLVATLCPLDAPVHSIDDVIKSWNNHTPLEQYQQNTPGLGEGHPGFIKAEAVSENTPLNGSLNENLFVEFRKVLALYQVDLSRVGDVVRCSSPQQVSSPHNYLSEISQGAAGNPYLAPAEEKSIKPRALRFIRKSGAKYARRNFSPDQIEGLEAAFQEHRFIKKELREQLAKKLSLSERSISYWFQNKRARSKPPITMSSGLALKTEAIEEPVILSCPQLCVS